MNYSIKNWADLAKLPVSKESEIKSHKSPEQIKEIIKVKLDNAFKRKRKDMERGDTHLNRNWREERRLTLGTSSKAHNLTPKMPKHPKIVNQHKTKYGGLTRRSDR